MGVVVQALYSVVSIGLSAFAPLYFFYTEGYAPLLHIIAAALVVGLLDLVVSENVHKTLRVMNRNGFSTPHVLVTGWTNQVTSWIVVFTSVRFIARPNLDVAKVTEFSVLFALKLFAALAISELAFTMCHKYLLHLSSFSSFHRMHHCCKWPSYSSNMWFNPVDFFLEHATPIGAILGFCVLLGDYKLYFWGVVITFTWYTADHDEFLKLPHYQHHRKINQNYNIYLSLSDAAPKDQVAASVTDETAATH